MTCANAASNKKAQRAVASFLHVQPFSPKHSQRIEGKPCPTSDLHMLPTQLVVDAAMTQSLRDRCRSLEKIKEVVDAEILQTKLDIAAVEMRAAKIAKLAMKTEVETEETDHPAVVSVHVPDLPAEERRSLKAETKAEVKTEQTDLSDDDYCPFADALTDDKFDSEVDDNRELQQRPGPASGDTTSPTASIETGKKNLKHGTLIVRMIVASCC